MEKSLYFSFSTNDRSYSVRLDRAKTQWALVIFFTLLLLMIITLQLALSVNYEQSESMQNLQNNNASLLETNQALLTESEFLATVEERIVLLEKLVSDPESVDIHDYLSRIEQAGLNYKHRANMLNWLPNGSPVSFQRVSSKYGPRLHPISKQPSKHIGIDLSVKVGTSVYAPADGFVEYTRSNHEEGYGTMLRISHGMGFMTLYAHLKQLKVKNGQFVRKGQLIALSGNSGASTAPHLHYEIRFLNKTLDPQPFMDWNIDNFELIFKQVKDVPWDYLNLQLHNLSTLPIPLSSQKESNSKVSSTSKDIST